MGARFKGLYGASVSVEAKAVGEDGEFEGHSAMRIAGAMQGCPVPSPRASPRGPPHISISDAGGEVDLDRIEHFPDTLIFGPERRSAERERDRGTLTGPPP